LVILILLVGATVFVYLRKTQGGLGLGPSATAPAPVAARPPAQPVRAPEPSNIAAAAHTAPEPTAAAPATEGAPEPAAATADTTASAAPAATAAASGEPAEAPALPSTGPNPAALPPTEGVLVVETATRAAVYVNGKYIGPTGEPNRSICGTRFVRVAKLTEPPTVLPSAWLSAGGSIAIACQAMTTEKVRLTP
jgi:hypothetical protein